VGRRPWLAQLVAGAARGRGWWGWPQVKEAQTEGWRQRGGGAAERQVREDS
jgi:hypothetical protein